MNTIVDRQAQMPFIEKSKQKNLLLIEKYYFTITLRC